MTIRHTIKNLVLAMMMFFALPVMANTLYIDPITGDINPGSDFIAKVKINNTNECVNSVDIGIEFPNEKIRFKDFSSGNSILSLWINKPNNDNADSVNSVAKVNFSGGIPGGHCSNILGDVGENNILGEIIFHVLDKADGNIELRFSDDSLILANDGMGTEVDFDRKKSNLSINDNSDSEDEWSVKIDNDNISPEPFLLSLGQDEFIGDGKHFLMFSTTDKQTGIDRFEVLEVDKNDVDKYQREISLLDKFLSFFVEKKQLEWVVVQSPYIVKDQSLNSVFKVRAIDKAGNYREVTFDNGIYVDSGYRKYLYIFGVFAVFVLLSMIITFAVFRFKK